MKQTAVEWIVNELYLTFEMKGNGALFDDLLNQAKEMEKEQIISVYWDAYNEGRYRGDKTATEYYNETFKSE